MKNYKVAKSKIHGNGIFADKDFFAGEDIGHLVYAVLDKKDGKEYFTSQMSPSLGTYLERSELEKFLNHSAEPNAKCRAYGIEVRLIASQPIKKGEEITAAYEDAYLELDKAQITLKSR